MNFLQAKDYIEELNIKGSILGLENMQRIMEALNNPQDDLSFIHVSGTNGKGSVCAYVSECLINAGYRVGIYTSPVVFEYLEKIRVGHRNISQKDFADIISKIKDAATKNNIPITAFEAETAAAFLYFAKKDCDIVVLETGLGGESDATNIVNTTILSIFTSISLDHVGILGKTVSQIALVKSGIIKKNSMAVSSVASDEVKEVLKAKAEKMNSPITFIDGNEADKFKLSMKGEHQKINASLALVAINKLKEAGFDISDADIKNALEKTNLPGRMEIISKRPLFIIDGAHNVDAARCLRDTLLKLYPDKKKLFIMGMFSDKDYEGVINQTADLAEYIITLKTPVASRALSAYDLAKAVALINKNVSTADSVEEAVEMAKLLNPGMIVAFGSLSYLGHLKEIIKDKKNGR